MKSEKAKVLHEINGKPMISYVVEAATRVSGKEVVVVVGTQAEQVKSVVSTHFDVRFAHQEQQLGTGHAVSCAIPELSDDIETVIILCGDVPLITPETLSRLIEAHVSSRNDVTILSARMENPYGYGRLVCEDNGSVVRIVEEADATDQERRIELINTGIYCTNRDLLVKLIAEIGTNNAQQEMYLTDIVGLATKSGLKVGMVPCRDVVEMSGINTREDMEKVAALISSNEKP